VHGAEWIARNVSWHGLRERVARAHTDPTQAENDVPQPHDFDACGFTKTKPCCISVS
jgi:hypothetical protein